MLAAAWRYFFDAETTMKLTRPTTLTSIASFAFSVLLPGVSAAAGGSISGQAALAMAGVVAPYSSLPAAEKKAVAAFFAGKTNVPYTKKIIVAADKIVCRTSNVDITARSCELTFGTAAKKFTGREANEVYSTEAMAGIPPDGAAGSNFESISKLSCTLDPAQLKDKAGTGTECSYQPAN
jgi:hypothetical protein